jgi:hypothetical protein
MTDIVKRLGLFDGSDIVERLRSGEDGLEYAAADEIERLSMDRDVWRNESIKKQAACEQMGARITALEAELSEAIERGNDWCDQAQKARAERDRIRMGLLRAMQYNQKCDITGRPCDARKGCDCELEAVVWCDGDGT